MSNIGLLVYDLSLTGGAENVAINLANEFNNKNNVTLISSNKRKEYPVRIDNSIRIRTIAEGVQSITRNYLSFSLKLRRILIDDNIDFLIAISAGVVTLAVGGVRRTKTKLIYCEHSNLENRTYGKRHILRQYIGAKCADIIVTLTERDRNNFQSMFHIPGNRVVAIPNWYTAKKSPCVYDGESKKIISVGRLEPVKGYDYLIRTAKKILANNPDWQWDIYGDGSLRELIQKKIIDGKIERLYLRGNVENILERYSEYAFLVMTSQYEGLPLSLLEAQSSHLPIVSFDCPTGPSEIISNNINGFLVSQNDIDELEVAIQKLIDSQETRLDFSAHAYDKLYYYEKDRVLNLWNELFEFLL